MLQLYFQNLWNKLIKAGALLLLLSSSLHLHAQSGFYNNFQQLIKINKANYLKKLERMTKNPSELNDLIDHNLAELDPDFINTLIFYTPSRYSTLVSKDKCSLYDLILSELARTHEKSIQYFIVRYKNKDNVVKNVAVNKNIFMEKIAYKQCPSIQKFYQYFTISNVEKTLKNIILKTPKSDLECLDIHQEFLQDFKTPYLCKISERIQELPSLTMRIKNTSKSNYKKLQNLKREQTISQKYLDILNKDGINYLNSLCTNLEKPKLFCESFFKTNFWDKAISGERSKYYILNMCQDKMKSSNLTAQDLQKCANEFSRNKNICRYLGNQESILLPKSNCEDLSQRINRSHLFSDYVDCPGKVANDGIINATRIINHFEKKVVQNESNCSVTSTFNFAKFVNELTDGRFWNVGACYQDKIYDKEECFPMVYGNIDNNDYSITNVINRILLRTKGFGENQSCEVIDKLSYSPNLLRFKTGCFILINTKDCYGTHCDFEVILNERKVDDFKVTSGASFDYFPQDFKNENYAINKLLKNKYQLNSKNIINIAFLKDVFKKHPKAIIHGVACAEDLLPSFYRKEVLNQCRPLPFIVDGYREEKGIISVIMRTAHDSLHAPRLVPWSYLFSSLKDYQRRHPLNIWGLNAIYQ